MIATAASLVHVAGVVQGVGFRPFVHRLACEHHLRGWVRNTAGDVEIAVEGDARELEAFVVGLRRRAPPMSRVESLRRVVRLPEGLAGFHIQPSALTGPRQPVSPDLATCASCERELFDPANRRFGYAFITCTDCGPRFSVIEAMPYDRGRTSMRAFDMCPDCEAEYAAPGNRRFHSQTNSCQRCGPRLWLADADGTERASGADAIRQAAGWLRGGAIVALRGLGGFQLAVDATDDAAVRRLRTRKQRNAKPLAVMVRHIAQARSFADTLRPSQARLLASPARPVVIVPARPGSNLAGAIAPGLRDVGLMLPATPLHHLLAAAVDRPLVMTSGNRSDEPIAIGNEEARSRLGDIADVFLLHDREIVARCDDSVERAGTTGRVFLRRARGYAPLPLRLPVPAPRPLLAVGPHLKNTLTLADGDRAWMSQQVGDLESLEALEHFRAVLARLQALFRLEPEVIVRDRHPGYLSTRLAAEFEGRRVIAVQHHVAHIAAVAAEHGVTTPVIGVACDGAGYGDDGTIWGAEVLVTDGIAYQRVAHFMPAPLPGGDHASRTPWRSALGYLARDPGATPAFAAAFAGVNEQELAVARAQLAHGRNAPVASSLGRLFDAAAAVLGRRWRMAYEGQAAMELEALAGNRPARALAPVVVDRDGRRQLDPLPLLVALGERRRAGDDVGALAALFHESVAAGLAALAMAAARDHDVRTIVLGGGSFQNLRLASSLRRRLRRRGLRVLEARALPPNDGSISYGQAVIAAAILTREGVS